MNLPAGNPEKRSSGGLSAGRPPPAFHGVLFASEVDRSSGEAAAAPSAFADLNLERIIGAATVGRERYDLDRFFRTPLADVDAVRFRHEVFRDLENGQILGAVKSFASEMSAMRDHLANAAGIHHKRQNQRWFLDAVDIYGDAIVRLIDRLKTAGAGSRGLAGFRDYLANYVERAEFSRLLAETKQLKADLAAVRYCLDIKGDRIKVRKYDSEAEYSSAVLATFEKFRQGTSNDYTGKRPPPRQMNHIEAAILDLVARLYPDLFAALDAYGARSAGFLDATVAAFDREIQFYVAYLDYIAPLKSAALPFCYPDISTSDKTVSGYRCFDIALADKLRSENAAVVCNDFFLAGKERIFVVSGPNQGGKTTFARTFGQMHFLASLGLPVPGTSARLFLFDKLLTHFDREEDMATPRGRLEDDLVRIHEILSVATSNSIVIMNEIFSSTTLEDALLLGKKIMARIEELDLLCVCVTFIDELATLNEKTVSLVSTVDDADPAERTYKILRRPAAGLAYAMSVAEKYGLTYDSLKQRIRP